MGTYAPTVTSGLQLPLSPTWHTPFIYRTFRDPTAVWVFNPHLVSRTVLHVCLIAPTPTQTEQGSNVASLTTIYIPFLSVEWYTPTDKSILLPGLSSVWLWKRSNREGGLKVWIQCLDQRGKNGIIYKRAVASDGHHTRPFDVNLTQGWRQDHSGYD